MRETRLFVEYAIIDFIPESRLEKRAMMFPSGVTSMALQTPSKFGEQPHIVRETSPVSSDAV